LNGGHAPSEQDLRAGRYLLMVVSDTGTGMDDETRRHIFEPFFTTKDVGKGTGLGLSMIQGIVKQSGGAIEVESRVGQGTSFKIYLPSLAEAVQDAERPRIAAAAGGRETVLVVEDHAEVREFASAALRSFGYQVIEAESAASALRLCEEGRDRVDLVLTDVVMPNSSGRDLATEMGQRWPAIKVLFMSGYTDDAILRHGVVRGDAEFIQKPFSPNQLALKVREMLLPPEVPGAGAAEIAGPRS
jgi:CheY-like chemotaxis protein